MSNTYRLIGHCPDTRGIVAQVTQTIAQLDGLIIEAHQHLDRPNQHFYMRYEFDCPLTKNEFSQHFAQIAETLHMQWRLRNVAEKIRVIIMVSAFDHCFYDLWYRWQSHELPFELLAVISNHQQVKSWVQWQDIPFHYIPFSQENKHQAFENIEALWQKYQAECIVLARFMQILPSEICARYPEKIINIHHSFLPSFIGAKPYHQAYARGVKLIGATCHYVTEQLDAGPIIEQDVIRVRHDHTVEDLIRLGRDVEKQVLARGLRYHLEDRVLVRGNKTVVLA
jgi:formyltetrahydrofolate deformylase